VKVRIVGSYTEPRTWGVYRVERDRGATTFHFGNHPIRQYELEHEFGNVELVDLYLDRQSALQRKRELQS
jgi:hypothetical protein